MQFFSIFRWTVWYDQDVRHQYVETRLRVQNFDMFRTGFYVKPNLFPRHIVNENAYFVMNVRNLSLRCKDPSVAKRVWLVLQAVVIQRRGLSAGPKLPEDSELTDSNSFFRYFQLSTSVQLVSIQDRLPHRASQSQNWSLLENVRLIGARRHRSDT